MKQHSKKLKKKKKLLHTLCKYTKGIEIHMEIALQPW